MARIADQLVERLKTEILVQRLAEARGLVFKKHGSDPSLPLPRGHVTSVAR
jgi:hypothetical protein